MMAPHIRPKVLELKNSPSWPGLSPRAGARRGAATPALCRSNPSMMETVQHRTTVRTPVRSRLLAAVPVELMVDILESRAVLDGSEVQVLTKGHPPLSSGRQTSSGLSTATCLNTSHLLADSEGLFVSNRYIG